MSPFQGTPGRVSESEEQSLLHSCIEVNISLICLLTKVTVNMIGSYGSGTACHMRLIEALAAKGYTTNWNLRRNTATRRIRRLWNFVLSYWTIDESHCHYSFDLFGYVMPSFAYHR